MDRLIVYGDIHGCYDELVALREKIGITKEDTEICVGDFVNKGKDTIKVLDLLIKENIKSVLGNNEEKLIRYLEHEKAGDDPNPVTLDESYLGELTNKHIKYLYNIPLYMKIDNYTIVHGGVQNSMNLKKLSQSEKEKVIRLRYLDKNGGFLPLRHNETEITFWADIYNGDEGFILYGHQPFEEVRENKYALGLDTGCVYGNKLSAAVIDKTGKIKIVQIKKQ